MPVLETLVAAVEPWARFYSDSTPTQAVVVFAHVGGMLWGGGLALSADRSVWKLRTAVAGERTRLLDEIARLHAAVLTGLGISVLSGMLLTAADLEEFATSPFWWRKVVMVGLLVANGAWLQRQERRMRAAPATVLPGWKLLTVVSALSVTLWFTVVLFGVLLAVI
jgi:hypothetical protein